MKEGKIKDRYNIFINEFQTFITVSYILAVGIGMLFTYQKFSVFGINIFEYADVFNFLIAPFSDFKILLFTTISLTLSYFLFRLDLFLKIKYSKFYSIMYLGFDKKKWFDLFRYLSYIIVLIFYLYIAAIKYGEISKNQILNQSLVRLRYSDNEIKKGKLIGKINEIIFLLADEKVEAIPITSLVKEYEIIN